ncbi:MAG: formylmethanofuran dehydrogenase subunit E family protein [Geopsychrobacter sp.]|nr:formylmethanofuran dehydrogenase subunit E family protein [Geopsychrobacter sp.]
MFSALAVQHGHYCPMSTLGLRIGWAAQRRLVGGTKSAIYKIQTCAVDGIRLALDFGGLQVDTKERHRLLISDQKNNWIIELRPEALKLAASYRSLDSESERDALLKTFRTAPENSLLLIGQNGSEQ